MKKIKLDNVAVAIVVFIVCVTLVSVMLMQFKTVEETDITEIENMRETELRTAISEWKTKYEEVETKLQDTNKKISEYSEKITDNEKVAELISDELEESNMAVGKTDVYGEGVIVTLNDDEKDIVAWDLIDLVNELKYAGAEAISINDVRIINTTDIFDIRSYTYITVGQQRLEPPYIVKAIGNPDYLSSILNLKDSGFVDRYKNSGKSVKMEISKKIQIKKYNGEMSYKYMKEVEEE